MTTATLTRRVYHIGAVGAALAAGAAALATWQLWPQSSTATVSAVPTWFKPIASYYQNDPRITPRFDFASLYSGYPAWFTPIETYYHDNPAITPQFDFASLYGGPRSKQRR